MKFFWNKILLCYFTSLVNPIQVKIWEFCCLLLIIGNFSALIRSLARSENCANALHALSHLIITTILWNRNYFLHFIVKTEARHLNDLPKVMQLASSKGKAKQVCEIQVCLTPEPIFMARVYFRCLPDRYRLTSDVVNPQPPLEELHFCLVQGHWKTELCGHYSVLCCSQLTRLLPTLES